MKQEFYILASVILGKLYEPRVITLEKAYALEEGEDRIEDLKIKLRGYEARLYGSNIAVNIKVDILCLVENKEKIQLKTWQEAVDDHIALSAFNYVAEKEEEMEAQIKILRVSIEGEKRDRQVYAEIKIVYAVFLTSCQEIKMEGEREGENSNFVEQQWLRTMIEKMDRLIEENYQLKQALFRYEQDIKSLKLGIKKAERRNRELKEELNCYKKMPSDGKTGAITEKDVPTYKKETFMTPKEMELGYRIRRMFKGL